MESIGGGMKKWVRVFCGISLFVAMTQGMLHADEALSQEVMAKLKSIDEKQDKILSELESIKSELNVVKIRTTLNG
jgi:hypothetical protein